MDNADRADHHGAPDQSDQSDMPDRVDVSEPSELSATEAAQVLGVAERSVRWYIAQRKIRARRVLSERGVQEYRISAAAVAAFQGQRSALDHESPDQPDRPGMPDQSDMPDALAVQDGPHA